MLALNCLRQWAAEAGFDDCGAAQAVRLDTDAAYLQRWLQAGCNGSMQYMADNVEKRVNPQALVPDCKTVVVCVMSYYKQCSQPEGAPRIAMSGLSQNDYHDVMKRHLLMLERRITDETGLSAFSQEHQHLFCDSAPILERRWAQRAGLGWIGRNRQLIHPRLGSYVHIGILLMQATLADYSEPYVAEGCADCDRCVRQCPTGALRSDPFDARKCVSYLTIERKEPLEEQYRPAVRGVLYGCDICARACPYNTAPEQRDHEELAANPQLLGMTADDWSHTSRRQQIKLLHRLARRDNAGGEHGQDT